MIEVRKINADDFTEDDIRNVHIANSKNRDTYVIYDKYYFEIRMSKDFYIKMDSIYPMDNLCSSMRNLLPVINICSLIHGYVFDCSIDPKDECIMIKFYISIKKYNGVIETLSLARHFDHVTRVLKSLYNDNPYFSIVVETDNDGDIIEFSEVYLSTMTDESARIPAKVRRVPSRSRYFCNI